MSDLEKDIYNFIRDKDIDFFQTEININITVDNYQFNLIATFIFDEDKYGDCEMIINCNLLKDYYKYVELSDDFKQEIADYFAVMINYSDEHLLYLIRLSKCLIERNITYTA